MRAYTRMVHLVFLFAFLSTNIKKAMANDLGLMEDLNVATATLHKAKVDAPANSSLFAITWSTVLTVFAGMLLVMFGIRVMLCSAQWVCSQGSYIWSYQKQWAAHLLVYMLSGKPDQLNLGNAKDIDGKKGSMKASRTAFALNNSLAINAPNRTDWVLEQSLKPATLDAPQTDTSVARNARYDCFPGKQIDLRTQVKSCNSHDTVYKNRSELVQELSFARNIKPNLHHGVCATEEMAISHDGVNYGHTNQMIDRDIKMKPARPCWNVSDLAIDKIDHPILASRENKRGKKPDAKLLRANDLMESGSANHKDLNFNLDFEEEEEEWSDNENECVPRAPPVPSGDPMDGEDVGLAPKTLLKLPRSQVGPTRLGSDGRSVLDVPWDVPPRRKRTPNGRRKLVPNGVRAKH